MCVHAAKALTRLRACVGASGHWLIIYLICIKILRSWSIFILSKVVVVLLFQSTQPLVIFNENLYEPAHEHFELITHVFVCFCCFTSHVNSYGHCGTVSSLNHTFSWAGLSKRLTSNLCTYFRL